MCHHAFCTFWAAWVLRLSSAALFATVEGVNAGFTGSTTFRDVR
jgi:hypothetical protein